MGMFNKSLQQSWLFYGPPFCTWYIIGLYWGAHTSGPEKSHWSYGSQWHVYVALGPLSFTLTGSGSRIGTECLHQLLHLVACLKGWKVEGVLECVYMYTYMLRYMYSHALQYEKAWIQQGAQGPGRPRRFRKNEVDSGFPDLVLETPKPLSF